MCGFKLLGSAANPYVDLHITAMSHVKYHFETQIKVSKHVVFIL